MSKNQIDVAREVEDILIESGLHYKMMFNPDTIEYVFVSTNEEEEKKDEEKK